MKTEIGGYFELELTNHGGFMYDSFPLLNSGRHALEFILKAHDNIRMLYVPRYTCDVVYQTLNRFGIPFQLYHINDRLEIADDIKLEDDEYIVVNNYFGLKDDYIRSLTLKYRRGLIVDNAQAWYTPPILFTDSFYSPRKFFGIPDGGIAIPTSEYSPNLQQDQSYEYCGHLLKRLDLPASEGREDFAQSSERIKKSGMMWMSKLTKLLLSSINFDWIKIVRRSNYDTLASALDKTNLLETPSAFNVACPMVYPYRTKNTDLRQKLIDNKIFVATYWPNVINSEPKDSTEYLLATEILPLPIDQRYGEEEMQYIIKTINDK